MPTGVNPDARDSDSDSGAATDGDYSTKRDDTATAESRSTLDPDAHEPRLASRVLVTWFELTVVGITGGLLGATVGGPPGFVIYLATSLLTIYILFFNVNELVKAWVRRSATAGEESNPGESVRPD